jgi:hypothetical protein
MKSLSELQECEQFSLFWHMKTVRYTTYINDMLAESGSQSLRRQGILQRTKMPTGEKFSEENWFK